VTKTLADRARNFLDVRRGLWVEDDAEAVGRARGVLGGDDFIRRLDDSEREYVRDQAGKFSGAGDAADSASGHAELARAAAAGSSSPAARSRARKADESAALSRVAEDHGDHADASRHAGDAARHAEAAVKHSGVSEWTVRERMSALREVAAAKASADPAHLAQAHSQAARAMGLTTSAGREHASEATRHASDARAATRGVRVGVTSIAGDDSLKSPPPPAPAPPPETTLDRLSRESRELRARGEPGVAVFNKSDDFGRRAGDNERRMARESVARERKAASDRQITAQHVTAKIVSLPSARIVRLPGLASRLVTAARHALSRSDELSDGDPARYDARVTSPADRLRSFLKRRYGVDAERLDEAELVRRCSALLGRDVSSIVVLASRADASDREYERDEGGKFASTGAASDSGEKASTKNEHADAAQSHRDAAADHRSAGPSHAEAAKAHESAARSHEFASAQFGRDSPPTFRARQASTEARSASASAISRSRTSSASHHEEAKAHAERARAAAAGTTPAARASARKAEESAALSRVAHEHGDLDAANRHAVDARRHADAAVSKSGRVGERPIGEHRATLAVQNKPMAEIAAARSKVADLTPSPAEATKIAALHEQMKLTKDQVGPSTRTPPATTTPMPMARVLSNEASAATQRASGGPSDPQFRTTPGRGRYSTQTDDVHVETIHHDPQSVDSRGRRMGGEAQVYRKSSGEHVVTMSQTRDGEFFGRSSPKSTTHASLDEARDHARRELAQLHARESSAAKGEIPQTVDRLRQASAPTAHSDQHLGEIVNRHAQSAPEGARFLGGRNVYSSELYDHMPHEDRAKFGTLDQFKDKLVHLNREGHVELGRIDARGDADSTKLAKSHIEAMQRPGGRHAESGDRGSSLVSHVVVDRTRKF